jgi:serine/threonine protein phosphatase PrpC
VVKAAAGPWSWSAPLHRSRCGASHQRRGVPCQDASLCASLQSADGLPVGLMAVADGHGGSRYWLSDVGSRLACELAIAIAAEDLTQRRLSSTRADQLEALRDWLADDLPQRLVAAWQQAIAADWQQRERPEAHQDDPFSSQTYGSTLALVVLTPHWWAHTGLGDWDLVLLSNHQPDRILSQEADQGLQGEATESLCLPRASRCFAARTAVYPLRGKPHQACGLVLSTDGIRKSCATDADHLALSRYLLEESQPHQAQTAGPTERLDASLDRISREGSGDDVSVALACFGTLQPGGVAPAAPELPELPPLRDPVAEPSRSSSASSPATSQQRRTAGPPSRPRRPVLIGGLSLIAGGVAVAIGLRLLPPWRRSPQPAQHPATQHLPLTTAQRQGVERQISRLCSEPDAINATLKTRNKQFAQLRSHPKKLSRLLISKDWLGAVIGLSAPGRTDLGTLTICPELATALRQHWRTTLSPTASTAASDDGLRTGQRHPSSPGAPGSNAGPASRSPNR